MFGGIRIFWDKSIEENIAGYVIERQDSNDGINWGEDWTVIAKVDAITYLDSPLDLDTYYRYRIKAFTRAGIEGIPSVPTADSIQPKRISNDDIVAGTITADRLYSSYVEVSGAAADVNNNVTTISGGKITAYSITADKLSVTSLSAICATLGTITAGVIYGTRFYIGAGTNQDFYFVDSEIRMYDWGLISGIPALTFKHGSTNFFTFTFYPDADPALVRTDLTLTTPNKELFIDLSEDYVQIQTDSDRIYVVAGGNFAPYFTFYWDGGFGLPDLDANPGAGVGQLCSVNGVLKYHNGTIWKTVVLS